MCISFEALRYYSLVMKNENIDFIQIALTKVAENSSYSCYGYFLNLDLLSQLEMSTSLVCF